MISKFAPKKWQIRIPSEKDENRLNEFANEIRARKQQLKERKEKEKDVFLRRRADLMHVDRQNGQGGAEGDEDDEDAEDDSSSLEIFGLIYFFFLIFFDLFFFFCIFYRN